MIRIFDLILASLGVIILCPFFIILFSVIYLVEGGPVFFVQKRIGQNGRLFRIYKLRTMKPTSQGNIMLTIGKDDRITKLGYYLRKYKIDELPQLINVINGSMSIVGPRPEVANYVKYFGIYYDEILSVRPGITDEASLKYKSESEVLDKTKNPEEYYINQLLPEKLKLSLEYVRNYNLRNYFRIIVKTIWAVIYK